MKAIENHITCFNDLNGRIVKVSDLKSMLSSVQRSLRSPMIRNGHRAALQKVSDKLAMAVKASGRHQLVKMTVVPIAVPAAATVAASKVRKVTLGRKADYDFGENFPQFKDSPSEAILHLMKVKRGEVKSAMYRKGIGHIDFVWGQKGFGLAHIIDRHGREMQGIGLRPEIVIPNTIRHGAIHHRGKQKKQRIEIETADFRVVIDQRFEGKKKILLLTAFDLRTIDKKRLGINGTALGTDGVKTPTAPLSPSPSRYKDTENGKKVTKKQGLSGSALVAEGRRPGKPLPSQPLPGSNTAKAGHSFTGFTSSDKAPGKPRKVFSLKGEVGKLLGSLQNYRLEIVIAGETHSGKSELGKQIADAFLSAGFTVGWIDWEQGGLDSRDTLESIQRNVKPENRRKLMVSGEVPQNLDAVKALAGQFQVICLDSGSKIKEMTNAWIDTLRMQYPDTIWVILMQQNVQGGTRGGSAAEYDAPLVIKTYRPDRSDFRKNYAYVFKNRGNPESMGMYYNIADKKLLGKNYDPEVVSMQAEIKEKDQSRPRVML